MPPPPKTREYEQNMPLQYASKESSWPDSVDPLIYSQGAEGEQPSKEPFLEVTDLVVVEEPALTAHVSACVSLSTLVSIPWTVLRFLFGSPFHTVTIKCLGIKRCSRGKECGDQLRAGLKTRNTCTLCFDTSEKPHKCSRSASPRKVLARSDLIWLLLSLLSSWQVFKCKL